MLINVERLLEDAKINITDYRPKNKKPYILNGNTPCSESDLSKHIFGGLGQKAIEYPELITDLATGNIGHLINPYLDDKFSTGTSCELPEVYQGCQLNSDISDGEPFLTKDDIIVFMDARLYASIAGIKESEISKHSRVVGRKYMPLEKSRITEVEIKPGELAPAINTYLEPKWLGTYTDSSADVSLFTRLVNHLFPVEEERFYFYCWMKVALTIRAYTYLILSGTGGNGKNTLKEVMRALFGNTNLVDGKMSTIKERFNSQLENSRLLWGDEWKYGFNEEPVLKEIQNDYISIERKGIDATRSTRIYCSMVISNNYPEHNYIAFDSRKFVPLLMTTNELPKALSQDEISELRDKINHEQDTYDANFIASIYEHIMQTGDTEAFKNLEYKGPGFYRLANLTMFKWQKSLVEAIKEVFEYRPGSPPPDKFFKKKNFSLLLSKKANDAIMWHDIMAAIDMSSRFTGTNEFPGNLKVHSFLKNYRDMNGLRLFEVGDIEGVMENFSIKYVLNDEVMDL
jgi:hypothetical protein